MQPVSVGDPGGALPVADLYSPHISLTFPQTLSQPVPCISCARELLSPRNSPIHPYWGPRSGSLVNNNSFTLRPSTRIQRHFDLQICITRTAGDGRKEGAKHIKT